MLYVRTHCIYRHGVLKEARSRVVPVVESAYTRTWRKVSCWSPPHFTRQLFCNAAAASMRILPRAGSSGHTVATGRQGKADKALVVEECLAHNPSPV